MVKKKLFHYEIVVVNHLDKIELYSPWGIYVKCLRQNMAKDLEVSVKVRQFAEKIQQSELSKVN